MFPLVLEGPTLTGVCIPVPRMAVVRALTGAAQQSPSAAGPVTF